MAVDLPDTPEIMVLSSDDKPMEGLADHLEEKDDLEEDQEIDKIVEEQPIDEEIIDVVGQ